MSKTRKRYIIKLIGRCLILGMSIGMYILRPESFQILEGMNFFKRFSIWHLLWGCWVVDMILQIIPIKNEVPLGSQKLFKNRFRPLRDKFNYEALRKYIVSTTKAAYKVFILYCALIVALGGLFFARIIDEKILFLVSICFYVCDLICVLIWCPFRLIMRTRCCTTCRIFNWDHIMMFSPLIYVQGFYSISLVVISLIAWLVWELCIMMYPERFWEVSNVALRCTECTDKLCTQFCQKLRK